jgi:GNAT superfamily N-acetyltransferase
MLASEAPGHASFVAVDPDNGIVGFGTCGPQRTRLDGFGGEFYAIYLYDFAQNRGYGRALMAGMAADLMRSGHRAAVVWVLRDNPARWFYERLGAVRLAEQPIMFAGSRLSEVAYGWRDLTALARQAADPSAPPI